MFCDENLKVLFVSTAMAELLSWKLLSTISRELDRASVETEFVHNTSIQSKNFLKGLSHEIDFKNFDKNLQNLA